MDAKCRDKLADLLERFEFVSTNNDVSGVGKLGLHCGAERKTDFADEVRSAMVAFNLYLPKGIVSLVMRKLPPT